MPDFTNNGTRKKPFKNPENKQTSALRGIATAVGDLNNKVGAINNQATADAILALAKVVMEQNQQIAQSLKVLAATGITHSEELARLTEAIKARREYHFEIKRDNGFAKSIKLVKEGV